MKSVSYADQSFIVGDDVASALIEFARVVASDGLAETVTVQALDAEGQEAPVTLLLNASTQLCVRHTTIDAPAPENSEVTYQLTRRIEANSFPVPAEEPTDPAKHPADYDLVQ